MASGAHGLLTQSPFWARGIIIIIIIVNYTTRHQRMNEFSNSVMEFKCNGYYKLTVPWFYKCGVC